MLQAARSTSTLRRLTKPCTIRKERIFIPTSRKSILKTLRILTCSSAVFPASRLVMRAGVYRSLIREVLSFLSLQESLKPSDLGILYLKTFPVCLVRSRDSALQKSLKRFQNWGIAFAGACLTAKISESDSQDDGCSLSDVLESEVPSQYWLSERSTKRICGCS